MKRIFLLSVLIALISSVNGISQTKQDTTLVTTNNELKGLLLDSKNKAPMAYANIYVMRKNTGAISNEKGWFSINHAELEQTDTLRFQYIGYKTRMLTISQLDTTSVIYLEEEIINLSEALIFGSAPSAKSIVKKVLQHKDSNYRKTTCRNQTFIRERYTSDISKIKLNLKKSSISQLDEEMIKLIEDKVPKNSISYNDFLGDIYHNKNHEDSITLKINPIRSVSLKEKDIAELDQIEAVFEDVFTNINEEEYWKVKTGIFSQKIENESKKQKNDTVNAEQENDTIKHKGRKLKHYAGMVKYRLSYSLMEDKKQWEFLYKTGSYYYTLVGGTRVNGEDVYIIDFSPKKSGKYTGRMYISTETYALIRADYKFAEGKLGRDINLLGIGYTESQYSSSIYFEKEDGNYFLKYFSKKTGNSASFERSVALVKKKKRFLFDKKLNEIKVGVDFALVSEQSFEYLVLDYINISDNQFDNFTQEERMETIYVDQFDDSLWKGFAIIEPTEQMREYKKQEIDFSN